MTVTLVTGAGGFVGTHLCRHLDSLGVDVRRVSSKPGLRSQPELAHVDLSEAQIVRALEGVDVVYFLAGIAHEGAAAGDSDLMQRINVEAPARWLRVADQVGVARFVWLSSIKVLGDTAACPLSPDDPYRPEDDYARSKVAAEQCLLGEPVTTTGLSVVRPPLVYGPGVRGNFGALLRLAASGLPLPLAGAAAPRSLVAVANLCDLLARLGSDGGGVFHVADDEDLTGADLIRVLRRLLETPARQFYLPPRWIRTGCGLIGRRDLYRKLFEPLRVDITATRARLGWVPPHCPADALQETVTWFRSSR